MKALRKWMLPSIVCLFTMALPGWAGFLNPDTFSLGNGLKVVVLKDHRSPMVDVFVAYHVGSADEVQGKSGLAHFLEHLMFKGVPGETETGFPDKIQGAGGKLNAHTSLEFTVYYETMPKEQVELALSLEAKRMGGLKLTENQVERERKVVLEELSMRVDGNHNAMASQSMLSKLLIQHPYRRPVIGYAHEVKELTLQDIYDFHDRWYAPNNATLVLSGDITEAEARVLVEKHFGPLALRQVPSRVRVREPEATGQSQVRLSFRDKRVKQPELSYLMRLPPFSDDQLREREAYNILENLLSTPNKGALWKALVEEQKVATQVKFSVDSSLKEMTLVELIVTPSPQVSLEKLEEAVAASIKKSMENINTIANEKAVEQVVNQTLTSLIYAKDNMTNMAGLYANYLAADFSLARLEAGPEALKNLRAPEVVKAAKAIFSGPFTLVTHILPQE